METTVNKLVGHTSITCDEYLQEYKNEILPDSEKLFVREFLFPILGEEKMTLVVPQYPFIDSEGHSRKIDFGIVTSEGNKIAFEVNGETYHSEGIIPSAQFDDNLFRQNEILFHGWTLRRYSYNQLQDPAWRARIYSEIKLTLKKYAPELLPDISITPNQIQKEVLPELENKRKLGWHKGLVIMPMGTGKTYLSALDALQYNDKNPNARFLFIVHRLEILTQSKEAYSDVWPNVKIGQLGGGVAENVKNSKILFASKDTLCREETLKSFKKNYFDYIIVDEVHHGECDTYKTILEYFTPDFLLGITGTPDRTDKKDILELFDYQKVCEYTLNDAIEKGFLVSYDYHGLKDNIDYSNIKWNGTKYDVKDLDTHLIIDARNEMIYEKYIEYCKGNKTIGFCASIKHAKRMAEFFNAKGTSAVAIVSDTQTDERKEAIKKFRNNEFAVAFAVDIFNEGVDIPNVQSLLFLRPTESKTIFLQQLGRGLRLSSNKDKTVILDFIGNYKRANLVRQYLAKGSKEKQKPGSNAFEKMEYNYNPKCTVEFDDEVQEILDIQDEENHDVNKDDLTDAYFDLKAKLGHKPSTDEVNAQGKYKVNKYVAVYESWIKFLTEIGETTENGYHYPQGLSLGHIMYILRELHNKSTSGFMNEKYIRMRGNLDKTDARLSRLQRQTKYKLQGMMGMGLVADDRKNGLSEKKPELTALGEELYQLLKPLIDKSNLSFRGNDSWDMTVDDFTPIIKNYLITNPQAFKQYQGIIFSSDAPKQLLQFLYFENRSTEITKKNCYHLFVNSAEVQRYCEKEGIEAPAESAAEHRIPFQISLLETLGIVETNRSNIYVKKILIADWMFDNYKDVYKDLVNGNYSTEIKEKFGNEFINEFNSLKLEVL